MHRLPALPALVLVAALSALASCSTRRTPAPGPVPLASSQQMQGFLSSGRLRRVGPAEERERHWWDFHRDGTFTAQSDDGELAGRWTASMTELRLTGLGGETQDRTLPLRWLDGKLSIEIDGAQYRRY